MWEQAQFWVSVVSAVAAVIAALAAVGFLRKEKIVKGELYTTQQERDDLRKRLAQADARLIFVDPERFLDQADELAGAGKYAELDTLATRFTERQSEAFGRAAEILTEQRILDSETDPLAIKDAQRFAQIGLAADPQNKRLADMRDLADTRAQDIARGDPIEALKWEGMSDVELNALARALVTDGRYLLAEVAAKRSVPLALLRTGEKSTNYAHALGQHANCLRLLGQHELAEGVYRESLKILEETVGTTDLDYGLCLNGIAVVLNRLGRQQEAESFIRKALEIEEATIGTSHSEYAISLANLADVRWVSGQVSDAEELYRRVLKIHSDTIGTTHPDYADDLDCLAGVLEAQEKYDEAEELLREALAILRGQLREDHPSIKRIQNNLDGLMTARSKDTLG